MTTKSGHTIRQQYCWSDYQELKSYMKAYKNYEYYVSDSLLYIYEDGHLVYSYEIAGIRQYVDNWALVNIRGSEEKYREEADIFHTLSNKFAELCMDIEMGNKDV